MLWLFNFIGNSIMSEKQRGKVKFFNKIKGFGFITPENGGNDCFVHQTALQASGIDTLHEGDEVLFVITEGKKGPQAEEIEQT